MYLEVPIQSIFVVNILLAKLMYHANQIAKQNISI